MSSDVSVQYLAGEEKCSQKCIVPLHLLEKTSLKFYEYVSLRTARCAYICRVYLTLQPLTCIFLDDTVTCIDKLVRKPAKQKETLIFPENLSPIEVSNFTSISVKILLRENSILNVGKTAAGDLVRKILAGLVVGKNCLVNCVDIELAKLFNVSGVLVTKVSCLQSSYGKLTKATTVEVVDVTSLERLQQVDSFEHLRIGGVDDALNSLKFNVNHSYKMYGVLVTGSPGCGKSLLVKRFCRDIDGFLVTIDRYQSADLTIEKCKMYLDQFCSYLKIFPDRTCMLFIDKIDSMTPYNSKQNLSIISALVYLINSLTDLGVYILATAAHKGNINPVVGSLFNRDVSLGIPSLQQRKEIIAALAQDLNCKVDCDKVARMTPGFLGHDISLLLKEAINVNDSKQTDLSCLTTENIEKALESVSPSVLKTSLWNIKVKPVYWTDIGGMFHVKKRLQMCIEWPLLNPEVFKKVDLPCPRGVLLFGPPGCCKTTLARGLATECNANFFAANPAQIYSPYVGESEKNIIELFYQARLSAPSIIFLDELDSLVSQRKLDKKSHSVGERVLSTLLNEMDGFGTRVEFQNNMNLQKLLNNHESLGSTNDQVFEKQQSKDDVIVVAATNRPDLIDDALLRPGRFDIILYVPPPNTEERDSILQTLTTGMPIRDVDMKYIAEKTDLFSGADLKYLCNEAGRNALRHDMTASYINKDNFDEALRKIKPSITRSQLEMYERLSSKYGTVIKKL